MEWKIIGNYQVSDTGEVMDLDGNIKESKLMSNGYRQIYLDGKNWLLHRLVATLYVDNPEDKPCVDHIDGDKSNNCANNLRWCTYKENNNNPNTSYKNSNGLIPVERTGKVLNVFLKTYNSIKEASEDVGCDDSGICKVLYGKRNYCGGYRWRKKAV